MGASICGGYSAYGKLTAAYCTHRYDCSYHHAEACEGNGIVEDGPTNCCWYEGGFCGDDAHCCGEAVCIGGLCGGEIRGDVPPQPRQNAAYVAVWLSRQVKAGNFSALYDWLHPDVQALVPRSAVIGWLEHDVAARGPELIEVQNVLYFGWRWHVTGQSYPPGSAQVRFRQPFADGTVEDGELYLAKDEEGRWRWFFGDSLAFVEEQIERFVRQDGIDTMLP